MLSYTDDGLFDGATNLANDYPDDLTQDLDPQIISFKSNFKTKIKQFYNVLMNLYINSGKLRLSYYISRSIYFFFVITYIVRYCLCNRALFSRLKTINNSLRSSVGQMRRCGLVIFP
jgi:hypothetical protein